MHLIRQPAVSTCELAQRTPLYVRRLALVVATACRASDDPRNLVGVCKATTVGVAPRTLRAWCRRAGLGARSILDLVRASRAVLVSGDRALELRDALDADVRTVCALFLRGGFATLPDRGVPISDFLWQQRWVSDPAIIREVIFLLEQEIKRGSMFSMRR